MSHEDHPSYFDNPEVWSSEIWQKHEADCMRAKLAGEWLPAEVKSILDVGCGNGVFTNMMEQNWFKVGLDQSRVALVNVTAPRMQGSAAELPFVDNTFDASLSMEMLEHLPVSIYQTCLSELVRVASRYVLITVPYCEKLSYNQVVCPVCRCSFHPYHHLRQYQRENFETIFGSHARLMRLEAVIPTQQRVFPAFWNLVRIFMHRQGRNFPANALCPQCGYKLIKGNIPDEHAVKPSHVRQTFSRFWPLQSTFTWWMALYSKVI